ncbi:GNAT family N-acetyltransferase [Pseudochelatococcus sp. B33]
MGSIADIPAVDWDACAHDSAARSPGEDADNPFLRHAFLLALEESGSVSARTGWRPLHLTVHDEAGGLAAAAPCYLKGHSRGEYVFDHAWADAYERAGGRYYPKLLVAVPFTPVTGPRLLVRAGPRAGEAASALIEGLRMVRAATRASSIHVNFATRQEAAQLEEAGFLPRIDCQYHWTNEGFSTFEDFLATLASRKRKTIRRERREALGNGISVELLTGDAITPAHWDAFYVFYLDTAGRKWGRTAYLTRAFYDAIGRTFRDRVLLVMARRGGRYIGGAINFIGRDTLFGRHWGAVEEHPFLHFEACYYQAIDFAIARGLKRVEAGAQGEHKLARGYRPVLTHSTHDIADPDFRRAVAAYLAQERPAVEREVALLQDETPFRHQPD